MTTTTDTTKTKGARQAILATVLLLALALSLLLVAPARQAEALPPGDGCWPYCDEEPPPQPPPPRNDAFSGAITLPVPGLLTGSTSLATMEAGEPRPYSPHKDCGIYGVSNSVWFKVTVPSDSYMYELDLRTQGSDFDTVLALYQGSSLDTLRQVDCSNDNSLPYWTDHLDEWVYGGQTYYVQLTGTGGARSGYYQIIRGGRTAEE